MKQFVGFLIIIALVIKFWPWILAGLILWLTWKIGRPALARHRAEMIERRERRARYEAEMIARCDQQDAWVIEGDPRGTYGEDLP